MSQKIKNGLQMSVKIRLLKEIEGIFPKCTPWGPKKQNFGGTHLHTLNINSAKKLAQAITEWKLFYKF